MRGLIGKKIGMTQIYNHSGGLIPVTVVEAGPCVVTQVKTKSNDGYEAIQVGFGQMKEKHSNFARATVSSPCASQQHFEHHISTAPWSPASRGNLRAPCHWMPPAK